VSSVAVEVVVCVGWGMFGVILGEVEDLVGVAIELEDVVGEDLFEGNGSVSSVLDRDKRVTTLVMVMAITLVLGSISLQELYKDGNRWYREEEREAVFDLLNVL